MQIMLTNNQTTDLTIKKLLGMAVGSILGLIKYNVVHNHAIKEIKVPKFTKNGGIDNHPVGRVSFECMKKFKYGGFHGKYRCTIPQELLHFFILIKIDKTAMKTRPEYHDYKHLSRSNFAIPITDLLETDVFDILPVLVKNKVIGSTSKAVGSEAYYGYHGKSQAEKNMEIEALRQICITYAKDLPDFISMKLWYNQRK